MAKQAPIFVISAPFLAFNREATLIYATFKFGRRFGN